MPRALVDLLTPVPSDIEIAQSLQPLPIAQIAQELDLGPDDYDLYGKYKAKAGGML